MENMSLRDCRHVVTVPASDWEEDVQDWKQEDFALISEFIEVSCKYQKNFDYMYEIVGLWILD